LYLIRRKKLSQIKATVIAHSKSSVNGKEIITMELEYPRFIHGELMTHRVFSRNAASSRAIPIKKMIELVENDPAVPIHWGKNQPGMQAKEELDGWDKEAVENYWKYAAEKATSAADMMSHYGAHKQLVNRILEPFQIMKTIVTATEWENFYWLRNHEDSQPEIKRLAEVMLEAVSNSKAIKLLPGEWHLPYYGEHGALFGNFSDGELQDALAISASCCAQVSYRLLDDSLEKARMVYKRLVESSPVHASPFEHQASPIDYAYCVDTTELANIDGATHLDKEGNVWSGNFQSWIQHRQLIPNNVKND
jgi:hypothetical protein